MVAVASALRSSQTKGEYHPREPRYRIRAVGEQLGGRPVDRSGSLCPIARINTRLAVGKHQRRRNRGNNAVFIASGPVQQAFR